MSAVLEKVMAKKRGPAPSGKPWNEGKAVRLDPSLVSMARAVATSKGLTIGGYLEPMFAANVRKDYAAMLRELEKGGDQS